MFGRGFFGHGPFGRGPECGHPWAQPMGFMGGQHHGMGRMGGHHRGMGHWGGFGERFAVEGGLTTLVLDVLSAGPATGYELMQRLEERLKGVLDMSPEVLYPVLQLLEDQGYVSSDRQEGRKVFAITEEGRKFLAEHADDLKASWDMASAGRSRADLLDLMGSLHSLAWAFGNKAREGRLDAKQVACLREILERAKKDIQDDLAS